MTIQRSSSVAGLAFLGLLALGGCESGEMTEPTTPVFSLEDQVALELLADPSTTATALEMAGIQTAAANRRGYGWGAGHAQRTQAEFRFQEAQNALAQGDLVRARDRAREGRRLVAEGIELAGGSQAILGMVERLEALPAQVTADPDAFSDPGRLGYRLGQLATQARHQFRAGNRVQAGALGVLGEQVFRYRYRNQNQVGSTGRAELAVALGGEAVALAEDLLSQQQPEPDSEQLELLETAKEFLAQAQAALDEDQDARAAHLAHLAMWWSLKAVVLPGGITDEEARTIYTLASDLLEEATAAVELDPTELNLALLAKATRMFLNGEENLTSGACRGIGALWQSAVISSYLIG